MYLTELVDCKMKLQWPMDEANHENIVGPL